MEDNREEPILGRSKHANCHVGKFLELPALDEEDYARSPVQLIRDGHRLSAQQLLRNQELTLTRPILVHDTPRSIGMKMLEFPRGRKVTVRDIADLLGNHYPVHIIDVEHQEELEGWTLADLVEYFEDEERLLIQHTGELRATQESIDSATPLRQQRRRRKAAEKCMVMTSRQRPRVLNQISLEFSKTALSEKILSPAFVRELDWIDHAWPRRRNSDGTLARPADEVYPNVQYYCLTSAAGCYTDFHVDFGGTSVWYHVLNGEKAFCLIPPTKENLVIYEEWLCRPDQASVFLPDLIPNPRENVLRISLKASETLVIPTAWIHAVYTPSDSLVIGGNFMHGQDISLQIAVHCIESRTRVQEKFRFPFFLPLNFYAGGYYLNKLRKGIISQREVEGIEQLVDALDQWWKLHAHSESQLQSGPTVVNAATECAQKNGCGSVEEFLAELRKEQQRVLKVGISTNHVEPVTSEEAIITATSTPTKATSSLSAIKTKLRLSFKGKTLLSTQTGSDQKSPASENEFKIVVASSKWNASVPAKQKRPREDTEWIDDGLTVDDEWMPKGGGTTTKSKRNTGNGGVAQAVPPRQSATANASASTLPRSPPKPSTSRQRLMKRFR